MRFAAPQLVLLPLLALAIQGSSRCLGQEADAEQEDPTPKETHGEDYYARNARIPSVFCDDFQQSKIDFLAAVTDSCGLTCVAVPVNVFEFKNCLDKAFSEPQLVWPGSTDWDRARSQAINPYKYPAAVVYAESTIDVQKAVECAFKNGYKVSARGRGHSLQGWGVVDGALTIDMTKMCKPAEFVVDTSAQGPHIMPGSRYIATVKAGPGCTNAVMLHSVHKHFPAEEGAMVLIGSCPSVGITGYTLGGGMGDITPYAGYAADLLQEVEMVLYDGSVITASKDENPDLFWATRGGGGGNGIVTSLTFRIVEAPKSKDGSKEPKFTRLFLKYSDGKEAMARFQDYLYNSKSSNSFKFGGNAVTQKGILFVTGVYLGAWEEAMDDMRNAQLLDEGLLLKVRSTLRVNYTNICDNDTCSDKGIPSYGVDIREYESYGEVEARVICEATAQFPGWTNRTKDICGDLDLEKDFCYDSTTTPDWVELDCESKVVIDQLLSVSGDPDSFINHHGEPGRPGSIGLNGLLLPPLEEKTIRNLGDFDIGYNHFGHGAPQLVSSDATAFPWRNAGILTSSMDQKAMNVLLKDKAFKNDSNKLQGYYNYMSPEIPNWRRFYFGKNWRKITEVKGQYDPLNVFGKPITAELPLTPAIDKSVIARLKRLFRFFHWRKRSEL